MDLIKVPFPHMALNSHNVPPPDYLMFNTWKVDQNDPVEKIVGWVAKVAKEMPGGKIATLIINAHGLPGTIYIGRGITANDASKFYPWNGLVTEIWIVACQVAGSLAGVASGAPDGGNFCRDLCLATGAFVTAGVKNQKVGAQAIPIGSIDDWEGDVYKFDPTKKGAKRLVHSDMMSVPP